MPSPAPADVIRLWPDGPPTVIADVPAEEAYVVSRGVAKGMTFLRNISDPTLSIYAPAHGASNGAGVIVVPGGGWTINAWAHEGIDVVNWLVPEGYTVFLLKYRVMASEVDTEKFEVRWAAMDQGLMARLPAEKLPRSIGKLISTEPYLQARAAA